jgi:hypothetical protein
MALGFYQQDFNGVRSIGHAGDTVFFHSDLYLFIDKNVGIFISMNSSGAGAGALRAALGANFAERYFPEAADEYEATLDTAKEHGALVSGVYESSRSSKTTFVALTRYLGQFKVAMNAEGELLLPTGAKPTKWREVAPFVWRKVGGTDRFAAKLNDDGSVDYVTFEIVSPFTQFLTPPWYRSSATLTPLLAAALTALLATFILWPVRAIVRWRFGGAFAHSGGEAMSYRLVRIGALLVFVVLGAWAMVIQTISADLTALTSDAFSAQLRVTQLAQVLFYVAFALAAWNLFVVWKSGQSWFAKLWSAILLASTAIVIWFAAISGLLHLGANF